MPSPFPGMDPYLEGYLWPDVHHRLATAISDQLSPRLRPRYVARIEVQVVRDEVPEAEIGIMYPDVEVLLRQTPSRPTTTKSLQLPTAAGGVLVAEPPAVTPATLSITFAQVDVRVATVQVIDAAQNQLVTSIEILSPVNKREPGLTKYREKRRQRWDAHVHLVEIDLLRRGQRALVNSRIPESAYRITLTRAGSASATIWALDLADALPVVPVPLRAPDDDVVLDLAAAFTTIYDRAAYDLSVNYREAPPPPPLSAAQDQLRTTLLKTL